jgi:SAM-dependent methyltransferase
MDGYNAYNTDELAELYDCVYADRDDLAFWTAVAPDEGPILEVACGTGRVLIPLARSGHEITGLDLSPQMLERCRRKLAAEPDEVRSRVTLVQTDMTSFDLGRRFALVTLPFRGFQHLTSVGQQMSCLSRCRAHLRPGARLVIDLFNPDPALLYDSGEPDGEETAESVECPDGRRIRWWGHVTAYRRAYQTNECEMTYEVTTPDGATRVVTETFPMRYIWRYELGHLLSRTGFRVLKLYGDYDRSGFSDDSPELIAVAEAME